MSTNTDRTRSGVSPAQPSLRLNVHELAQLAEDAPDVYRDLQRQAELEQRHLRRLAWSDVLAQIFGNICGLGALAMLAAVAWHAIDRGATTQGAVIITSGAVAIVTVFVTGRVARREAVSGKISSEEPPSQRRR